MIATCLATGCGGGAPSGPPAARTWHDLLDEMLQPERMADLDQPGTEIITSCDPTGKNQDYNHYLREGPEGWVVFADLEGPGYVSRFWFTGGDDRQRFQFLFDNEDTPRIDTEALAFCGGEKPYVAPLAMNFPFCWFNLVPIPYRERLVILSQKQPQKEGGWPRHFYQINYTPLARDQSVESFPRELSMADRTKLHNKLHNIGVMWRSGELPSQGEGGGFETARDLEVGPGAVGEIYGADGPGLLSELRVTVDPTSELSPVQENALLRSLRLQITWDGAEAPSVDVPLGDFFGSVWHETAFTSLWFGKWQSHLYCRLPMPFQKSASIAVLNQSDHPVVVNVYVGVNPLPDDGTRWGYLHAAWNRSEPDEVGRPYPVLDAKGRGKFVGCLLAVTGMDKSWWILESDETMTVDGAASPQWKGTGLEDYFNGGWYYQNAHAQPLHGLLFKAPFRTVQYRFHFMDPVVFNESFAMEFEKGPDNASHGWMESVAYYYLDAPARAASRWAGSRAMPRDPLAPQTLMSELHNLERLGDTAGILERVAFFREAYRIEAFEEILDLRVWAYRERAGEKEAALAAYRTMAESAKNEAVRKQAADLAWFHDSPDHALLTLYCRNKTRVFLDGRPLTELANPARIFTLRAELKPGRHALALRAEGARYPDWILAHLRTHRGEVATDTRWRFSYAAEGAWQRVGFDDSAWDAFIGYGIKGPPEAPYIHVEPHGHVYTVSRAQGLRAPPGKRKETETMVARREFVLGEEQSK